MTAYNPFSLEGKTVFVTGASSGIGRAIAITCSKMGAKVIINGRNTSKLNETILMMEGEGHEILAGDLADSATLVPMADDLPKLDGIVHCAGLGQRIPCKEIHSHDVDEVMER